jgi:hypothetical protein
MLKGNSVTLTEIGLFLKPWKDTDGGEYRLDNKDVNA